MVSSRIMAFCPACGAAVEGRFCGACGANIDAARSSSSSSSWAQSAEPPPVASPRAKPTPSPSPDVRPSPPVSPPLGAREEPKGIGDVLRPSESTGLVHRHDAPIELGTIIEVGAGDVFYGVVEQAGARTVAFALMAGVRGAPEACEGDFIS